MTRLLIDLDRQEIEDIRVFFAHLAFYDYEHNTPNEPQARRANIVGNKLLHVFRTEHNFEAPAADPDELLGILRRSRKHAQDALQGSGDRALIRKIDEAIQMLLPRS